jgi:hypothetical protein
MIAKLMSRKKSYERIMRADDPQNSKSPNSVMQGADSMKKNSNEAQMNGPRGGVNGISRA